MSQTSVSIEELSQFIEGQQIRITYREGEVLLGTYYFIDVHYCRNGYYGLYATTIKRTVMGNEQRGGWQEYGQWKIETRGDQVGLYAINTVGVENFYPFFKLPNGDIFMREGVTLIRQGPAVCP